MAPRSRSSSATCGAGRGPTQADKRPKLDGFTAIIDQWLREDLGRLKKQRHTAKRVFERLRDEHGFAGGYTIVKDYVREHQRRRRTKPITSPARS